MMKKQGNGGPRNSPVGNLQIFCRYDQQSVFDTINDASANVPATFASGAPENFDLLTDEIAFIQLDHPSAINKSPSAPPVRSSLNGLGSHAAAAFPGDTAAQVASFVYTILPIGTVWGDNIHASMATGGVTRPIDVAVQVRGVHTFHATVPCGIGQLLQYYVPDSKELSDPGRYVQRGVPSNKVRLGVRPIDPDLVGKALMEETRRFVFDTVKWKRGTSSVAKYAAPFENFAIALKSVLQLTQILTLKHLGKEIVASVLEDNGVAEAARTRVEAAFDDNVLVLAKNLKLINPNATIDNRDADGFGITPAQVDDLSRQVVGGVLSNGSVKEFYYGFSPADGVIRGKNVNTGKLEASSAYGQITNKQLNYCNMLGSAMTNILRLNALWTAGTCTQGAVPGGPVAWSN